jgi:hypothetical protein
MRNEKATADVPASALIDRRIAGLGDWRGAALGRVRALIHDAVPGVVEEWKWMGTPVWSSDGILCTGGSYMFSAKDEAGSRNALRFEPRCGTEKLLWSHCKKMCSDPESDPESDG